MQHSRRLAVLLALVSPLVLLGLAGGAPQDAEPAEPVTVLLVRHTEKGKEPADDPTLTAAGRERAHDLAKLLAHAGVTNLYSSEYKRTAGTLAPLAEATELEVQTISARKPNDQVRALQELAPGAVAVVAGHSNTIPALLRALGGPQTTIQETEHDKLFLVMLPATPSTKVKALELRYGD